MKKTFEIIFISEGKDSNFSSAVLRVDPCIRESIQSNGNRVFLGLSSCKVTDQYHIIQCYTCQSFGHKRGSAACSLVNSQTSVCLYCAGNHTSKSCPSKKDYTSHKCSNCIKSPKHDSTFQHTSNSADCPILQAELKTLLNRTMGCNKLENISKNEIRT